MYLSLNGQLSTNNSKITVTEIGDRIEGGGVGGALLCYTDDDQCCNDTGRWIEPGGGSVGNMSVVTGEFFVSRGSNVVRLHRRNNSYPSGVYCCEVPNVRSEMIRTCANIGGLLLVNSKCHFDDCALHTHALLFTYSFRTNYFTRNF